MSRYNYAKDDSPSLGEGGSRALGFSPQLPLRPPTENGLRLIWRTTCYLAVCLLNS